ncbi:apolipoprotein N-acyltransferase [Nocardioides euryhalodurans]|uniref:apolipoprotein N-acyltransferase n=1 Tax=Nocardioides euryhalodurans TaxID=2518370 RepID=UPI001FC9B529|nr:apolipoprotein N-acyltransferase [Nocardioides euryhalodurans]
MLLRTGFALLAGALLAQAFEPVGLALLLPIGVAGFVLSVRGLPARRAWIPGLAFGIGFQFVLLFWMRVVGYEPWVALAGIEAAFYAPLASATVVLLRHRGGPLWFAAAWVAMETIRSGWPFSGMPWGRLSYAVAGTAWQDALPYVGMAGLSFLLALLGALLAGVVTGPRRLRAGVAVAGVAAASVVPTLVPHELPTVGERTVAVVQGDVPGDGSDILLDHRQVTRNHVDATVDLADRVEEGGAPRPDFVVWPENSTAVDPFLASDVNAWINEASAAVQVPILVGAMVDAGTENVLNQGIVWEPDTGAADRYTKWHPVPFGEYIPWRDLGLGSIGQLRLIPRDMLGGTRTEPLPVGGTLVADAICFDVAYDDGIHAQLRNGGQLLTVQTSNAMFIHTAQIEQQFEISRLRALETGRHVLVAATNGVSGVIAPDGTVVARAGIRTQDVLVEDVTIADGLTPAVWAGSWPGRAAVALTVLGLVLGLLPYRRRQRSGGVGT